MSCADFRVNRANRCGGDFGLCAAHIAIAEKYRSRKVRSLDPVRVCNEDVSYTQKGKILENFVSERTRTDNQNLRIRQLVLVPPVDPSESVEPVVERQLNN